MARAISDCGLSKAACVPRDADARLRYLEAALAQIPRLLGAIDRNPFRPTFGCLDRQFWHYRTSDFPSEMYQEGALPLALVYRHRLPGNRWQGERRVRELAHAAVRFAARSAHRDGSCDDYYPFERALGAAVFSLEAAAQVYELLELDDAEVLEWLQRRARWLTAHDESGRLANHQALAGLSLSRVARLTCRAEFQRAADERMRKVIAWQSAEGWFDEYGGADPGYQTVTIDCLAKYRRLNGAAWLDEPLRRAVAFARWFLHPDHSYGGEYGSRGTYHFYPHGMELLAGEDAQAADLADGFLAALAAGKQACFDDDRLVAHRLGNLIQAYLDWSPERAMEDGARPPFRRCYLPQCRLLVDRAGPRQTVISLARCGVFKHFSPRGRPVSDAGLIVELEDGRWAVSQGHDLARELHAVGSGSAPEFVSVSGPLHWTKFETATPVKFVVFRLGLLTVGRWCRGLVRRLLQRRLITSRREAPLRLTRSFELPGGADDPRSMLRVTDRIELLDPRVRVRRLSFGSDHQSAYVAASGVYQDAVLALWCDLERHVAELNDRRSITMVREFC